MAHRRGSFCRQSVGISQVQRRKKSWLSFGEIGELPLGLNVSAPALAQGPSADLTIFSATSATAAANGLLEGTLMRIRGSVSVAKSNLLTTFKETVAFGIGFVTDEAAAAGAVPNPATSDGADWDGWMFYRANVAAPADANATVMDAKSMRKWQSGMSLVFVGGAANNAASGSFAATTITIVARGLFLLP